MLKLVAPPREMLIVMLSALGDAVHVLPVVNAIRRAWPQTRITWILQPVPARLIEGHPSVDEVIVFHRRKGADALKSYAALKSALRGRHYDLLMNLQVYFKAGVITAMVDADIKLGFDRARARDANWLFTTHRIPPHAPQHVQDQYFEFVRYLGIDPEPVEWNIPISDSERVLQREFFASHPRACGIVVGTSKPQKNWNPEGYAAAIEYMSRVHGMSPVLVGGPSQAERDMARAIEDRCDVRIDNQLGDDLRKLVWLLDGCGLVLSPDTGPLHLARALGTPVIGLYGYTNPKRYGPYRAFGDLLVDGYARFPGEDYRANAEYREDGMKRVSIETVRNRIDIAAGKYLQSEQEPHGYQ